LFWPELLGLFEANHSKGSQSFVVTLPGVVVTAVPCPVLPVGCLALNVSFQPDSFIKANYL
jgi:hypothetical protein